MVASLMGIVAFSQETRSIIWGRVSDPQAGYVVGAKVTIRNIDTGALSETKTNETGYFEADLLLPGNYEVTAEAAGFKRTQQNGVLLSVSSRKQVDLKLEVGGVTETINVSAETTMLETNSVTSGRVLDNRTVMDLPLMGNSAVLLVKLTPGIQTGGVNNYLALHSNAGGSDYSVAGNVGGNSWTLDGSPNNGPTRRTAYLPYTDAVSEFKVETNNFDASIGQTSGAAITMISKSGSNDFHGTMTWQHWQQRWQGAPFFTKQNYYRRIAAAESSGNHALAEQLRNTDVQPTGRSNNWGASGGGPVRIPKVFDGRNKLFWFFTYNAFKDVKTEDPSTFNRTVPSQNARNGIFSDLLTLPNSQQYIVYDPASIAADPSRATHFVRTPFPNNVIPANRFVNPVYKAIMNLYPLPNVAIPAGQAPTNNYLASQTPYNWDYKAFSNRIDYNINPKFRLYGRWSYNNFGPEDRGDWTYESARGLNVGGLVRNNKGGNVDLTYAKSATTIWDFNVAMDQFREGNIQPTALSYKPSDIGLPSYLDQKAGDLHILPLMNVNGYSQISPGGYTTWTRYRTISSKAEATHIMGKHTMRGAFDVRSMFRTGGGGGNTSGNFTFTSNWTRKDDDGNAPSSNLPLGWAAFILGLPNNGYSIATNDNYALHTPYYGGYFQDSWRINSRLTLNLGLRMEWEGGATERYNRMITNFDPGASLPIAAAAQAAYAANPIPELAAANFQVAGGSFYANTAGRPRNLFQNQLMWLPRAGVAYQINSKTVVRGGYGLFYDTINVLNNLNGGNFGPDQTGFSRSTSPTLSTDFGQTWLSPNNPSRNTSPLLDPFWTRSDGTRFDVPLGNALGIMAREGQGWTFTNFNQKHARQQRYQVSMQRQIGSTMVITAAYAGARSEDISVSHRLDILPKQYWAAGAQRDDAIANNLNSNVTNPFYIGNFSSLQSSNPVLYQYMNTQGFFTSRTIRKSQLLRAWPSMNGVTNGSESSGHSRDHEFQLNLEKRFSGGWNWNFGYTAMNVRDQDFYFNEFDASPSWRPSNNGRPHRIVSSGIYEVPVGKGRRYLASLPKPVDYAAGGWQFGVTYEYQPGPLLDWGSNVFYYGANLSDIANVNRTWDKWFNTANFETNSAKGPTSFASRVFPARVDGLRADCTNQWNANAVKNLQFTERWKLQLRLDALNVQNRSQMAGPDVNPYSTTFGKITSQTSATNRWLQVQARLTF